MIKVAVAGYAGRMGSAVVDAVTAADDMTVVCGIDPHAKEAPFPVFGTLAEALDATDVDVLVDFTQPNVVAGTLCAAAGGRLRGGNDGAFQRDAGGAYAFGGAGDVPVLRAELHHWRRALAMEFAKAAAPTFLEAEVIECHHWATRRTRPPAPPCAPPRSSRRLARPA